MKNDIQLSDHIGWSDKDKIRRALDVLTKYQEEWKDENEDSPKMKFSRAVGNIPLKLLRALSSDVPVRPVHIKLTSFPPIDKVSCGECGHTLYQGREEIIIPRVCPKCHSTVSELYSTYKFIDETIPVEDLESKRELSEHGDLFTIMQFIRMYYHGGVGPNDGIGNFSDGKYLYVPIDWKALDELTDLLEYDSNSDLVLPEGMNYAITGYTHIQWFNR